MGTNRQQNGKFIQYNSVESKTLLKNQKKTEKITIRISSEIKKEWEEKANLNNQTMSAFIVDKVSNANVAALPLKDKFEILGKLQSIKRYPGKQMFLGK